MLDLLSGEFYKWKKSKGFKICLLSSIGMVVFVYIILGMSGGTSVPEKIGILDVVSECTKGGIACIFYAVFICIWIVGEYTNGAVKNIAGKGNSRNKVFLSKYLSTMASVVVMNIIWFAVILLGGCLAMGTEQVDEMFFWNFFSYVGMQLMFTVALSGIVVTICEFVRNVGTGIAISMVIMIFSGLISSGLDMLFHILHLEIKATTYWIMDVIAECPMGAIDRNFLRRGIFVTVMWTALSLVLGMVHFQKADIK